MTGRAEENRRAAWAAARPLEKFTAHDLMDVTGRSKDFCDQTIRFWLKDGLIERGQLNAGLRTYQVIGEIAPDKPSFGRERQSAEFVMWRTMRKLRRFTPDDVHLTASTEEQPLDLSKVQAYCSLLTEAGIITCIRRKTPGTVRARYKIMQDPGPFPPRLLRVPALYDPNGESFTILRKRVKT